MDDVAEYSKFCLEILDKMDGHEFEYACAELLRCSGYRDVEVTQDSCDYGVDILAKRGTLKYAIQCKRYGSNVGVKAVQEVGMGMDFYSCDSAVVMTNSYFTNQAKKLAKTTGVRLWGRDELEEFIEKYNEEIDYINYVAEKKDKIENIESIKTINDVELSLKENEKNILTNDKIHLYKKWYYQKGKIYFGKHSPMTPKGAKNFYIFIFVSSIIIIIMALFICLFNPLFGMLSLIYGIFFLNYANKIKKTLRVYEMKIIEKGK